MIKNLLNLFFPEVCYACSNLLTDNEKEICISCRHELPVTNYHFNNDSTIKNSFSGRVKLELATSLFHFEKKGIVQQLIHNLKYKKQENIGATLGKWLGTELSKIEQYKNIDIVIPVPLHKQKLKKRGYNQVALFGKEIAKALNADYVDDVLIKVTNTKTQVFKNRISRWTRNNEVFAIENVSKINNKHILLVDDIITTGATIEACANMLNNAQNIQISIATMAIA